MTALLLAVILVLNDMTRRANLRRFFHAMWQLREAEDYRGWTEMADVVTIDNRDAAFHMKQLDRRRTRLVTVLLAIGAVACVFQVLCGFGVIS